MSDAYIVDPSLRLCVWRVTVKRVCGPGDRRHGDTAELTHLPPPPIRCPAYTAAEAVQFAAVHSGIPRAEWSRYTFHPEAMPRGFHPEPMRSDP